MLYWNWMWTTRKCEFLPFRPNLFHFSVFQSKNLVCYWLEQLWSNPVLHDSMRRKNKEEFVLYRMRTKYNLQFDVKSIGYFYVLTESYMGIWANTFICKIRTVDHAITHSRRGDDNATVKALETGCFDSWICKVVTVLSIPEKQSLLKVKSIRKALGLIGCSLRKRCCWFFLILVSTAKSANGSGHAVRRDEMVVKLYKSIF